MVKATKTLCIGSNVQDTDTKTRQLSATANDVCHGLLSELDQLLTPESYSKPGYYHSSLADVAFGHLLDIANQFDQLVVLDQPISMYGHPDLFFKTMQLAFKVTAPVLFVDPNTPKIFEYFSKLLTTNQSFCIFPFVELLVNYDYTTVCCRSNQPVAKIKDLGDYKSNTHYQTIRQKMLDGIKVPEHCEFCYKLEAQNIVSPRKQETMEWAHRLQLESVDQLKHIEHPVYYEVRADNKCNLLCRTCGPVSSHLIEREYRTINIIDKTRALDKRYTTGFEIINFDSAKKIYIAGGEPTVMKDFYRFLDNCMAQQHTDIEILVNTNGTVLNHKLKTALENFTNFHFIFSIDGFNELNHYIRWPSEWNKIIHNWQYLRQHNHQVTVSTTVSIYNVASLHKLYQFIDQTFPNTLIHWQCVDAPPHLSPYLYPNRSAVLDSLNMITKTNCYKNDPLFASTVDGLAQHFDCRWQPSDLTQFFEFNDKLDRSRKICLADYLPELDKYR